MRRNDPWRQIIIIVYPGWLAGAGDGEFFRLMNPQIDCTIFSPIVKTLPSGFFSPES